MTAQYLIWLDRTANISKHNCLHSVAARGDIRR